MSRLLAEHLTLLGAKVTVVTNTPGEGSFPYSVVRGPTAKQLHTLGRKSDVILQSNISLKTLLPLFLSIKPIVIIHHTWITRTDGRRAWQDYLKLLALPFCHNVSVSHAIASAIPVKSSIINNPFEASEFAPFHDLDKDREIVFLGRLVSDKGCDQAIRAIGLLKDRGLNARLSIIGDGPERMSLATLANDLGVTDRVTFLGPLTIGRGREVARHKVMIIPSRWAEPFGLVALEGISAGCAVVAAAQGGLADAVGNCGLLFSNGDLSSMTNHLEELLTNDSHRNLLTGRSSEHLEHFQPDVVAKKYLKLFETLVKTTSP